MNTRSPNERGRLRTGMALATGLLGAPAKRRLSSKDKPVLATLIIPLD